MIINKIVFLVSVCSCSLSQVWPMPVGQEDAPITSAFGPRLYANRYDFHWGVDIRIWNSQSVVATHWGYVEFADYAPGWQKMVYMSNYDDAEFGTGYAHLSNFFTGNYDENNDSIFTQLNSVFHGGSQIATINYNDEDIDHLHFNYYTLDWDGSIPEQWTHTDHPMKLLPYDNSSAPFSPTDTWVATGSDNSSITTIQFDVETPYNEMDLNALTLWIDANTFETNFGERININTGDSDSDVHTQTTEISTGYGTIDLQITVFNFNTPNDHTIRFKYDLTNYYGSNNSSFPSDAIFVDIEDIDFFTTIYGFSAEHE